MLVGTRQNMQKPPGIMRGMLEAKSLVRARLGIVVE